MRLLLFILIMALTVWAKPSIDKQIKSTNAKLKNYDKRYKNAHEKLSKSAKSILTQQKKLLQLDKQLTQLNDELSQTMNKYELSQKELTQLQKSKTKLTAKKEKMRKDLSRLIAKQLSLEIILRQRSYSDTKAMMRGEVFTAMSRLTNQELKSTKTNIAKLLEEEQGVTQKMRGLSESIQVIDNKRKQVVNLKSEYKNRLAKLNNQRKNYKRDLEKSLTTKANLRKMLNKLRIIKVDQERKAKELARKKQEEKARKAAIKAGKTLKKVKVVKHGRSYEKVKTTRYRGKKTIAPLNDYKVVKKFGPYTDPVYDIKIFNDSVSLKPTRKNAIVRSILNGKVIISKRNKLLGNFVIIEHAQGLHSVYAHLDTVARTVKQGQRIKRGTAIGRVNNELMFQVTQKNHHLNPLEVIN